MSLQKIFNLIYTFLHNINRVSVPFFFADACINTSTWRQRETHRARMWKAPWVEWDCSSQQGGAGGGSISAAEESKMEVAAEQSGSVGGDVRGRLQASWEPPVNHTPQSHTWSPAWSHSEPLCSWWSWKGRSPENTLRYNKLLNISDRFMMLQW